MSDTEYFSRIDFKKKTGVSDTTLDRWVKMLSDTNMVKKENGVTTYSEDLVTFINARMGTQGPANLPEPDQIAWLCKAYRECDQHIPSVSLQLGTDQLIIRAHLTAIGLIDNEPTEPQVWSRVSQSELDDLSEFAKTCGITRSLAIRVLIADGLDRYKS